MSSRALAKSTLKVEVTNISNHGIWLLTHDRELFISYEDFPWFKDVSVAKILKVEQPSPDHFYWPDLDAADLGSGLAPCILHPSEQACT